MIAFLRLVRVTNLSIVIATILGVTYFHSWRNNSAFEAFLNFNFILFVFSIVLITAAGNIINDYFDVRADQVNKPNKLIISKFIKRRWAIVLHLLFNLVAFTISIYIYFVYGNILLVLMPFLAINLLWFYSWYLKKKVIIANIVIACLTGMVPLLTMVYLNEILAFQPDERQFTFVIIFFATIQNLVREIIKDQQDAEGDKLIHVQSIPIKYGIRITQRITNMLLLILPLSVGYFLFFANSTESIFSNVSFFFPIFLAALLNIVIIFLILFQQFKQVQLYSLLVKISLALGISSLFIIPLCYASSDFRFIIAP
jgi:4-hydroxybenzoate polyprenyltransferase